MGFSSLNSRSLVERGSLHCGAQITTVRSRNVVRIGCRHKFPALQLCISVRQPLFRSHASSFKQYRGRVRVSGAMRGQTRQGTSKGTRLVDPKWSNLEVVRDSSLEEALAQDHQCDSSIELEEECATSSIIELCHDSTTFQEAGSLSGSREVALTNDAGRIWSLEGSGGQRIVQLVAAWDALSVRLPSSISLSRSGRQAQKLLLSALKLTLLSQQGGSFSGGGGRRRGYGASNGNRPILSRPLAVAAILADLKLDAESIAAGLVHDAVLSGSLSLTAVEEELGPSVAALVKDSHTLQSAPHSTDLLDEEGAKGLRQLCLSFPDVRAVLVNLASSLDTIRHLGTLPRWRQQVMALETLQVWAPLAHALGTGSLMWELEDHAFRVLFPQSYNSMAAWLQEKWSDSSSGCLLEECRSRVERQLSSDERLQSLRCSLQVTGRRKSLYSTMKKLLRDGRSRQEVHDLLGLRIVVSPQRTAGESEESAEERAVQACYIAKEAISNLWLPVPGRDKDYIAKPKKNKYQSLHMAVQLQQQQDMEMEVQIRTAAMDARAVHGPAAHGAYKGGISDPAQAQQLRAIVAAISEMAAERGAGEDMAADRDHMFVMFDRNGDGQVSMEEVRFVMAEFSESSHGQARDAEELMALLDSDGNGSISVDEFREFEQQVRVLRDLPGVDRDYQQKLGLCLSPLTPVSSETPAMAALEEPLPAGEPSAALLASIAGSASLAQLEWERLYPVEPAETSAVAERVPAAVVEAAEVRQPLMEEDEVARQLIMVKKWMKKGPREMEKARECLQELVTKHPLNPQVWVNYAHLERKSGNVSSALSRYEQSIEAFQLQGDDSAAHMRALTAWATLEAQRGQKKAARDLLRQALRMARDREEADVLDASVASLHGWAVMELKQGSWGKARVMLERAEAIQPGNSVVLQARALVEKKAHNWKSARLYFDLATKSAPSEAICWQAWAIFEAERGNVTEMRRLFRRALDLNPGSVHVLQAWAHQESKLKSKSAMAAARRMYEKCTQVDPSNIHSWQAWAVMEQRAGNEEAARKLFQKGLQVDPNNVPCLQAFGLLEKKSGRFESAERLLSHALRLEPTNAAVLMAAALLEKEVGNGEHAQLLFVQASKADKLKSSSRRMMFEQRKYIKRKEMKSALKGSKL